MKYKILITLLICLSFFHCRRDEVTPWGWGNAQLTLNGQSWEDKDFKVRLIGGRQRGIHGELCTLEAYGVTIHKYLFDQFLREEINISKIPFSTGSFPIDHVKACSINDSIGASYYKVGSDGDVITSVYQVLKSENNFISISTFSKEDGIIEGTFQITFVNENLTKPDTLRFTNCSFKTKVL